jgi:hypothetical protein
MSDTEKRQADEEPAPLEHSDAKRVSDDDSNQAAELEDDPSRRPPEQELGDVKGA